MQCAFSGVCALRSISAASLHVVGCESTITLAQGADASEFPHNGALQLARGTHQIVALGSGCRRITCVNAEHHVSIVSVRGASIVVRCESGVVVIEGCRALEDVFVHTTTGHVLLRECEFLKSLVVVTTSGHITLDRCTFQEKGAGALALSTASGCIQLLTSTLVLPQIYCYPGYARCVVSQIIPGNARVMHMCSALGTVDVSIQ